MADGIEASADMITGGLIGRTLEQDAGAAHTAHDHPTHCLNCHTRLVGPHCHACGQAGHVHRTAGAIIHDIAHGVFHFEGKIWRTLPMLIRRPGDLTRRYVDGQRASFVSPLALFLFTVFLMFAIVANLPGWSFGGGDFLKSGLSGGMAETRDKIAAERTKAQTLVADYNRRLDKERREPQPDAGRVASLEKRLADAQETDRDLAAAERLLPVPEAAEELSARGAGENWFEAKIRHARENPTLLFYKLKTSAYKFSWALIPLSIPFLWLLFPFSRRFGLYDHAVFTTYSLTFMSLLTIALAILGTMGVQSWALITAAVVIAPIHIYKQMKGTYGLGRASALIRTSMLVILIMSVIVPAFTMLLLYLGLA